MYAPHRFPSHLQYLAELTVKFENPKMLQLEGHSVERIYLRQMSSDGSVNKTILKPRLAVAARRVGYSRRKMPRISTARWQPRQGRKLS